MEIKALIFDYGGTLDTDGMHWSHILWQGFQHADQVRAFTNPLSVVSWQAFRDAYVFGERTLGREDIIAPTDNFHQVLLKKVDLETRYLVEQKFWAPTEAERLQAIQTIAQYCNDYAKHNVDRARALLDKFAQTYRLVLVSNFYGNVRAVLQDYGLTHFSAVIESAEVGVRKPDPAIYRLGVEAAGVGAEECCVIGDSFGKDIVPAESLGCQTVWLKGKTWERETVDESVPTHIITSLTELANIF